MANLNQRSYRDPAFNGLLEFRKQQTKSPTQNEKEEQFTTPEPGKRGVAAVLSVDTLGSIGDPTMARNGCKKGLDGVSDSSTCTLASGRLTA